MVSWLTIAYTIPTHIYLYLYVGQYITICVVCCVVVDRYLAPTRVDYDVVLHYKDTTFNSRCQVF